MHPAVRGDGPHEQVEVVLRVLGIRGMTRGERNDVAGGIDGRPGAGFHPSARGVNAHARHHAGVAVEEEHVPQQIDVFRVDAAVGRIPNPTTRRAALREDSAQRGVMDLWRILRYGSLGSR